MTTEPAPVETRPRLEHATTCPDCGHDRAHSRLARALHLRPSCPVHVEHESGWPAECGCRHAFHGAA